MSDSASARSPLDPAAVAAVLPLGWTARVLEAASSTNRLAAEAVAAGPVDRLVVVADHQQAGRGRLDRSWVTPPGTALTFSAVLDPGVPDAHWSLLPLAAGLAVLDAVRRRGVAASLKWPNDVLAEGGPVPGGKLCGILVERVGQPPRAVVGIGINVDLDPGELPVATATSLRLQGAADRDRVALLGDLLHGLVEQAALLAADRPALLARYREACGTLGRTVRVSLPDGRTLSGTATALDGEARLVVTGTADGDLVVGAGDVVHVRPAQ